MWKCELDDIRFWETEIGEENLEGWYIDEAGNPQNLDVDFDVAGGRGDRTFAYMSTFKYTCHNCNRDFRSPSAALEHLRAQNSDNSTE